MATPLLSEPVAGLPYAPAPELNPAPAHGTVGLALGLAFSFALATSLGESALLAFVRYGQHQLTHVSPQAVWMGPLAYTFLFLPPALVFALLKVSPTPVCVMDEVDAMLDEANVGRFRDLLLELSKQTQFIIITHNRNTVQAADVIYGVTMGRDSASQIISLKLDEISEEYLK
jgi:hypothetical protein